MSFTSEFSGNLIEATIFIIEQVFAMYWRLVRKSIFISLIKWLES